VHKFRFSRKFYLSHRLKQGEQLRCRVPHGHTSTVTLELTANSLGAWQPGPNCNFDFDTVKRPWKSWIDKHVDQCLFLAADDPLLLHFTSHEPDILTRIATSPGDPTAEAITALFCAKAEAFIKAESLPVTIVAVDLQETEANYIRFEGSWRDILPSSSSKKYWWERADDSINDIER